MVYMGRPNFSGLPAFSQLLSAAIRPYEYYHAAPGNKPEHPVSAAALLAPRSVRAGVGVVVVVVAAGALLARRRVLP